MQNGGESSVVSLRPRMRRRHWNVTPRGSTEVDEQTSVDRDSLGSLSKFAPAETRVRPEDIAHRALDMHRNYWARRRTRTAQHNVLDAGDLIDEAHDFESTTDSMPGGSESSGHAASDAVTDKQAVRDEISNIDDRMIMTVTEIRQVVCTDEFTVISYKLPGNGDRWQTSQAAEVHGGFDTPRIDNNTPVGGNDRHEVSRAREVSGCGTWISKHPRGPGPVECAYTRGDPHGSVDGDSVLPG